MEQQANDFNTFKECKACGQCCTLTLIAVTPEEAKAIDAYIKENNIVPRDQGPFLCPFRGDDMRCMIYPVRSETCRLYHCQIPRLEILENDPSIVVDDAKPLLDMRRAFIHGDFRDPRDIDYVGEGLLDEGLNTEGWY